MSNGFDICLIIFRKIFVVFLILGLMRREIFLLFDCDMLEWLVISLSSLIYVRIKGA